MPSSINNIIFITLCRGIFFSKICTFISYNQRADKYLSTFSQAEGDVQNNTKIVWFIYLYIIGASSSLNKTMKFTDIYI